MIGNAEAIPWTESKRPLWLLGAVTMLVPLMAAGVVALTGWGVFWWFGPVFVFAIIPLADHLLGEDTNNPPESWIAQLEQDRYYRRAVYLAVITQYFALIYSAWIAVTAELAWWEYLGLALSAGVSSGIAINTGHELGHKTDRFEQWLAKIALAPTFYGHFFIEHNRGHHVRVATPEDPASSRFGESFWAFLPRTVIGSLRSAWHIESERLARNGLPVWHWQNHNLQSWTMSVVLFGALLAVFGLKVLPFLLIQAVYGFSLLEVVNYLEHYGLLRQKGADGRYERCQPRHSWNSNHIVSNLFLYHLQRHSDHHAHPTRSYQSLRHFEEVPALPNGYAGMVVLAYIPWLWFRVMDPKVVAHFGGDMSKANIQPAMRERVIAQYAC
ncbi:MAG TPA: alkane 1-monooxygenase [Solimonas sp.]|nr:alkane 1-monooxygenase [Solimonas sp.]